jgi:cell division topological specificity factor
MGLLTSSAQAKNTANVAKERLRILVAQDAHQRGGPDYLPLLQRELLEVIRKYVKVDNEAVQVRLDKEGEQDVLELNVATAIQSMPGWPNCSSAYSPAPPSARPWPQAAGRWSAGTSGSARCRPQPASPP